MEVLELVKVLNKAEIRELLRYAGQLNEAGLLEEYILKVDPSNVAETMYPAYYDLMIDSETGGFKPEIQNLFPSTGKDSIF
jgi:hypothetical protein